MKILVRPIASFLISWSGKSLRNPNKHYFISFSARDAAPPGNLSKQYLKVRFICDRNNAKSRRGALKSMICEFHQKTISWWCFIFINKRSGQKLLSMRAVVVWASQTTNSLASWSVYFPTEYTEFEVNSGAWFIASFRCWWWGAKKASREISSQSMEWKWNNLVAHSTFTHRHRSVHHE